MSIYEVGTMNEDLIIKTMNEYMAINGENHFIREIFKNDMQFF